MDEIFMTSCIMAYGGEKPKTIVIDGIEYGLQELPKAPTRTKQADEKTFETTYYDNLGWLWGTL